MISDFHKFMLIHINKTGGTAITRNVTRGKDGGHKDLNDYKRVYPNKFDEYFKFAFVRNPWSKTVSFYHYHIKRKWDLNWDWAIDTQPSFIDFVKIASEYTKEKQCSIFKGTRNPETHHKRIMSDQLDWITGEDGTIGVNFIGRFENLARDFALVCDKLNIPQEPLKPANLSNHKHYTEYYDDETRAIVAGKYSKDIQLFDYSFGE